jgi:LTXXQ motif family protein
MIILAGCSIVFAQQNPYAGNPSPDFHLRGLRGGHRYHPSPADMAAFTDARIAALRAGLELTPDQAKNWPAFEQALRDAAQLRMQYMQAREAQWSETQTPERDRSLGSPFVRLEQRADNLAKISAAIKKIADAGTPLYQSLTDPQKHRFTILARIATPASDANARWHDGSWHAASWNDGRRLGR